METDCEGGKRGKGKSVTNDADDDDGDETVRNEGGGVRGLSFETAATTTSSKRHRLINENGSAAAESLPDHLTPLFFLFYAEVRRVVEVGVGDDDSTQRRTGFLFDRSKPLEMTW